MIIRLNLFADSIKNHRFSSDILVTATNKIISNLLGKEMFGLVADGLKNENGEVPYPSTYICMINGTFKEWICIFNDLEVSICQIYIF